MPLLGENFQTKALRKAAERKRFAKLRRDGSRKGKKLHRVGPGFAVFIREPKAE